MSERDPALYARSFAEVYDDWYRDDDDATAVATSLSSRAPGATVLELGSGTGRMTGPLLACGLKVISLDISLDMLRVDRRSSRRIAADMAELPLTPESCDVVLVGFNTLLNLADVADQAACLREINRVLRPDGWFVNDSVVLTPAPHDRTTQPTDTANEFVNPGGMVDWSTVTQGSERTVLAITAREHDVETGADMVRGVHVEVSPDGAQLRPWRLCHLPPARFDELCHGNGLELADESATWSGAPTEPAGRRIAWYRRATTDLGA